ncbi:MAG: hypothetical protein CMJ64_04225 [Planctomycetaceae bacterium]|nr:hypothetical protein [Planctomycetaceae bacterium]
MRFASLTLVALLTLSGIGCHHNLAKNGCSSCGSGGGGNVGLAGHNHSHGGVGNGGYGGGIGGTIASHLGGPAPTPVARIPQGYMDDAGPAGPPSATYGYPYYTTRAPRDFLMNNPPSIGP